MIERIDKLIEIAVLMNHALLLPELRLLKVDIVSEKITNDIQIAFKDATISSQKTSINMLRFKLKVYEN
jgi:hypothetical protein